MDVLVLFQYRTCPFCCKVRAFLDFYGINYDIIEVNSVTRKQVPSLSLMSFSEALLYVSDKKEASDVEWW